MGKHNVGYSNGFSIQAMPVSSAILQPLHRSTVVHDGTVHLEGWAYSGGGNWPERIEVSPDGYVVFRVSDRMCSSLLSAVTYGTLAKLKILPLSTTTPGVCGRSMSLLMQRDGLNSVFALGTVSRWSVLRIPCPAKWNTASNNTEPTFVRSAWK